MGWIVNLVFFPYGKDFRRHRRLLNDYFNQKKCASYESIQGLEARRLIQSFTVDPEHFVDHLYRLVDPCFEISRDGSYFEADSPLQLSYGLYTVMKFRKTTTRTFA